MAGSSNRALGRVPRMAALLAAGAACGWFFPLFHVKRLPPVDAAAAPSAVATADRFDAKATAEKFWRDRLPAAGSQAADLARVVRAVRADPASARQSLGKPAGVGVYYFFLQGRGRVVARERNVLRLAVDGAPEETIELRIGPVFGNVVRDGCGLLDVNAFPGLQEFNALAAELNALVEKQVLPDLRAKAVVGAMIRFTGCAEAPDSIGDPGEPLFTVVPIQAEVR